MGLFWLVHRIDGARVIRIQKGGAMIFARLNAMIDGFGGSFVEAWSLSEEGHRGWNQDYQYYRQRNEIPHDEAEARQRIARVRIVGRNLRVHGLIPQLTSQV